MSEAKFKVGEAVWFEHGYVVNGVVTSVAKIGKRYLYNVNEKGVGTHTNVAERRLGERQVATAVIPMRRIKERSRDPLEQADLDMMETGYAEL